MTSLMKEGINLNTILLGIVLGMGSWTLHRVVAIGEELATGAQRDLNFAATETEFRTRLAAVEAQIQANQIALARLEGQQASKAQTKQQPTKTVSAD